MSKVELPFSPMEEDDPLPRPFPADALSSVAALRRLCTALGEELGAERGRQVPGMAGRPWAQLASESLSHGNKAKFPGSDIPPLSLNVTKDDEDLCEACAGGS